MSANNLLVNYKIAAICYIVSEVYNASPLYGSVKLLIDKKMKKIFICLLKMLY